MINDQEKKISASSQEEKPLDRAAASEGDASLTVALPRLGSAGQFPDATGSIDRAPRSVDGQGECPGDSDATVIMPPVSKASGVNPSAADATGAMAAATGVTGAVPPAADATGAAASLTGAVSPATGSEPFEALHDEAPELSEVVARDERSTTQPSLGTSSVKKALSQRPPRRAKAKRGPRTEMLESIIPDVVIPTDSLSTRSMAKVKVVEASALAQLREIAREQGIEAEEEDRRSAERAAGEVISDRTEGRPDNVSGEAVGKRAEGPHARKAASARPSSRTGRPSRRGRDPRRASSAALRIVLAVIALILLASAILGGLFAWDRWYRFDDVADITGEWKMTNAERTVVITEDTIKIADGVSYDYVLDTKEKTITYSFGGDSTTATYRFSSDRNTLVIDENQETDWMVAAHLREDVVLEDRDVPKGMTKLFKISNDTEADPQNTEDVAEETGDVWDPGTYVEGYSDIKRPKIKAAGEDDDDETKKNADGTDDDEEDESDEYDDGAAYVDETTGQRYYYDSTQMLYYDTAGNYYYDMLGNNPYVP